MPQQRPFFLSSFLAAFRQQPPAAGSLSASTQTAKSHGQGPSSTSYSSTSSTASAAAGARSISTSTTANPAHSHPHHHHHHQTSSGTTPQHQQRGGGVIQNQLPLHSPRAHGMPIPGGGSPGKRRGSDSSSEGFRDVLGSEKWYIGGRTATGDEKFFKLGVVKRVRSNDRLSLDRLSL